jgi:Xaa-Pro aminopeptidase
MIALLRDSEWAFRPPEPRAIEDGDRLAVMFRASWERYWSEATGTYTVRDGRLEPVVDTTLRTRFDASVERVRSGARISTVVDTILSQATAGERHALERCGGLGHGIGITADEIPIFSLENHTAVAPGMCLVLTAASSSSEGLALHADTVVI